MGQIILKKQNQSHVNCIQYEFNFIVQISGRRFNYRYSVDGFLTQNYVLYSYKPPYRQNTLLDMLGFEAVKIKLTKLESLLSYVCNAIHIT